MTADAASPKLAFLDTLQPGQRFGRFQVVEVVREQRRSMVLCRCDCGAERLVEPRNLKSGNSRSCGCLKRDVTVTRSTRHGKAGTRIYMIWTEMIGRCTRPTHARYADYGGRGINVCDRWLDFANFYEDMGDRPEGRSLDRTDNDAGYSPENCRWATAAEQRRNRRRQRYRYCPNGHEYGPNNTAVTPKGHQQCLTCAASARQRAAEYAERTARAAKRRDGRVATRWAREEAKAREVQEISHEFRGLGSTYEAFVQVSDRHGLSREAAKRRLKQAGIEVPDGRSTVSRNSPVVYESRFSDADRSTMKALYEAGATQQEIAQRFGTQQGYIGAILRRAGAQMRPSTPRNLTEDQRAEIRRLLGSVVT